MVVTHATTDEVIRLSELSLNEYNQGMNVIMVLIQIMRKAAAALCLLVILFAGCLPAQSEPLPVYTPEPLQVITATSLPVTPSATLIPSATPTPTPKPLRALRIPLLPGDLPTLDPQRAEDWAGIQISEALTAGLVRLDEQTGQVLPAAAQSWSISPDGKEITFALRQNIAWVYFKRNGQGGDVVERVRDCDGNPRMVTAVDWKLGLLRLLLPATNSPNAAAFASVIQNGTAYQTGKINNPTIVGIADVNPFELKLTFSKPGASGLAALSAWYVRPVPFWMVEGDQCTPPLRELWWQSDVYPSYGAFALKSAVKNGAVTLVRNPHWQSLPTAPAATIDEIRWIPVQPSELLGQFDAGRLDLLYFPPGSDPQLLTNPRYRDLIRLVPLRSTQYLAFRANRPPADDSRLRQALSLAIDRDQLARQSGLLWQPARWFTPSGVSGAPANNTSGASASVRYDPLLARSLLWKYLYEKGYTGGAPPGGIPASWLKLTLLFPAGARYQQAAEALQTMWREKLDLPVQLVSRPALDYQKERGLGWHTMALAELSPANPDADDFVGTPFFPGGSVWKLTGWQETFGYELFRHYAAAALREVDSRQRQVYTSKVEQILIEDEAVVAPLFWNYGALLLHPEVTISPAANGVLRFEFWSVPAR